MSSSSVQQIRPVIECFCQILSLHGFSTITPEVFRLAKFNRDEATVPLWRLLFELLHFDPTNSNSSSLIERFNRTGKDELIETVKTELFTRGYTNESFLILDNRMKSGSQQLLLAVGWLLFHSKMIEICVERCLKSESILDFDDTTPLHRQKFEMNELVGRDLESPEQTDLIAQVKQAMRLNSKLRFGLRRLHGLVIENANLQHQIHHCHNMSALEAYLCQNVALLSDFVNELEIEHQKLNLLLFWSENENVFWKWMESVLDQTATVEISQDDENFSTIADCQRFEIEKKKFQVATDSLDSAVTRLEQLCCTDVNANELQPSHSGLDAEVSLLFQHFLAKGPSINSTTSENSFFLHQPQRLVFAKPSDVPENHRSADSNEFERETTRLHKLQTSIDQQIEKQRTILDTLSYQFDNVMIV